MAYNSEILLGRITKVSGYEGAVSVKLEKVFFENIPEMESVFLEIDGKPVPFFISESEYSGAGTIKLTFEDFDSVEKVGEFINCKVFLTSGFIRVDKQEDPSNLTGYSVFINNNELLGSITEIISNPGQFLLSINSVNNKEILIPLHEDFIVSINDIEKFIVMDIPEGLIDLN